MRNLVSLLLIAALVGCTSPRGRSPSAAGGDTLPPRPFVGTPSSPDKEAPGALARRPLGMLAGSVQLGNRRVANATIQVRSLETGLNPPRKLTVLSDSAGWFSAPGLEKGQRYQLVASLRKGDQTWTGQTFATANDVRLVIYLLDTRAALIPSTPPEAGSASTKREAEITVPGGAASPAVPPVKTDRTRIAEAETKHDFDRLPPPSTVNVPGPGRTPPSRKPPIYTPPLRSEGGVTIPTRDSMPAVPSSAPPSRGRTPPERPAKIPSCVQPGNILENFALYDFEGNPWELARRQTGKVVLLHFWSLKCPHCPPNIPRLVELQKSWGNKYRGLQVVSILHDEGDVGLRKKAVQNIAARYRTRYNFPVLFSERNCPVRQQMGIHASPTFVLLNKSGRILGRWEGMTEITRVEIEQHLRRQGLSK